MKLPTSIENILNENIVENARLELKKNVKHSKSYRNRTRRIVWYGKNDDRMNHEAEIRDLKLPLIQNYLYEIKSDLLEESEKMDFIDLCKSMRIVDGTK